MYSHSPLNVQFFLNITKYAICQVCKVVTHQYFCVISIISTYKPGLSKNPWGGGAVQTLSRVPPSPTTLCIFQRNFHQMFPNRLWNYYFQAKTLTFSVGYHISQKKWFKQIRNMQQKREFVFIKEGEGETTHP